MPRRILANLVTLAVLTTGCLCWFPEKLEYEIDTEAVRRDFMDDGRFTLLGTAEIEGAPSPRTYEFNPRERGPGDFVQTVTAC